MLFVTSFGRCTALHLGGICVPRRQRLYRGGSRRLHHILGLLPCRRRATQFLLRALLALILDCSLLLLNVNTNDHTTPCHGFVHLKPSTDVLRSLFGSMFHWLDAVNPH